MKPTKIVYRRKYNLGNYETEDLEIEVEIQDMIAKSTLAPAAIADAFTFAMEQCYVNSTKHRREVERKAANKPDVLFDED